MKCFVCRGADSLIVVATLERPTKLFLDAGSKDVDGVAKPRHDDGVPPVAATGFVSFAAGP